MAQYEIRIEDPQELWDELYARIAAEVGYRSEERADPAERGELPAECPAIYASIWCVL